MSLQHLPQLESIARSLSLPPNARVAAEITRLDRAYQVAVVGEFKVGKSTLINRAFLGEDLLPRDLLECTAVPTLIQNDVIKSLRTLLINAADSGTLEQVLDNPSTEDIHAVITHDTPEGRADLANRTVSVTLTWPSATLGRFSVFDTPGINSGNESVIATTYRVVPECDCIVFMMAQKSLSQSERAFISSKVLDAGLNRLLILIACRDQGDGADSSSVNAVQESVRASLSLLGREALQVETVSLDERNPVPGTIQGGPAIRALIEEFVAANAALGRQERASPVAMTEAHQLLVAVQSELTAVAAGEQKRIEMTASIGAEKLRVSEQNDLLAREVAVDLGMARRNCIAAIGAQLLKVGQSYIDGFTEKMTLAEMQDRLQQAALTLQPEIEHLVQAEFDNLRSEADRICLKIGERTIMIQKNWHEIAVDELQIDAGIIGKLPPMVLYVADIILAETVLPFPIYIDIILREIINKIPGLRNVLLANLARDLFRKQIQAAIPSSMSAIRDSLAPKLEAAVSTSLEQLRAALSQSAEAEMENALASIRRADTPPDLARVEALNSAKTELAAIIAAVS